ncbi:MAG: DNA polymerase IV [Chloroflexi bacterium]|nr:DNA polymerase IV [Chloroflexota bacterium]
MSPDPPLILHADLDAFYASVEQRDRPELRGKPVIVGGKPEHRGVVAAASYEARAFGVKSAMPTRTALRLCPQATLLPPDFSRYREASQQTLAIYRSLTPILEPISLDEAYLDLTGLLPDFAALVAAGEAIRREVRDATGLTVSAGAGSNKLVAKIASDFAKPDGLKNGPSSGRCWWAAFGAWATRLRRRCGGWGSSPSKTWRNGPPGNWRPASAGWARNCTNWRTALTGAASNPTDGCNR